MFSFYSNSLHVIQMIFLILPNMYEHDLLIVAIKYVFIILLVFIYEIHGDVFIRLIYDFIEIRRK